MKTNLTMKVKGIEFYEYIYENKKNASLRKYTLRMKLVLKIR